jgi:hypothetical protein
MIEVDRSITFFDKFGAVFRGEILVNEIELQDLLQLITIETYKEDFLIYNCYLLDKKMLDKLATLTGKEIEYDLERFEYYLEATAKK